MSWVPAAERIAALLTHLPDEAEQEVLDFARFLHARKAQSLTGRKVTTKEVPG